MHYVASNFNEAAIPITAVCMTVHWLIQPHLLIVQEVLVTTQREITFLSRIPVYLKQAAVVGGAANLNGALLSLKMSSAKMSFRPPSISRRSLLTARAGGKPSQCQNSLHGMQAVAMQDNGISFGALGNCVACTTTENVCMKCSHVVAAEGAFSEDHLSAQHRTA